jgi:hypothetical protein
MARTMIQSSWNIVYLHKSTPPHHISSTTISTRTQSSFQLSALLLLPCSPKVITFHLGRHLNLLREDLNKSFAWEKKVVGATCLYLAGDTSVSCGRLYISCGMPRFPRKLSDVTILISFAGKGSNHRFFGAASPKSVFYLAAKALHLAAE